LIVEHGPALVGHMKRGPGRARRSRGRWVPARLTTLDVRDHDRRGWLL